MENRSRWIRLAAILGVVAMVVVIIFQNREPVETRLLLAKIIMPRAALLATTAGLGFVAGLLAARHFRRKET